MSTSRSLPLAAAQPGAVLAAAVTDSAGSLLLPAGLALTAAQLQGLRRRGISEIRVAIAADPAEAARRSEAARARVMHLFRHTANEPGSQALLHAVLAFREASS